jgi:hypothetical protein
MKLEDSRKKHWRETVVNSEEHQKRNQRKLGWNLHGYKIQSWSKISRKISWQKQDQKNFTRALPKVAASQALIKIFEKKHNDIRVTEVRFLQKKDKGDGFEKFHYNYKDVKGGRNDVSFTVVINLGRLNDTSENANINISWSNKEPSILTGSRREEMMQKLTQQEKEEINRLPKEDLDCLQLQMLNTKDID